MDTNLCSEDPWLVLHKVDSPTKMRYIGTRLAECNESTYDPTRVAPSIQPFVIPQGAARLASKGCSQRPLVIFYARLVSCQCAHHSSESVDQVRSY